MCTFESAAAAATPIGREEDDLDEDDECNIRLLLGEVWVEIAPRLLLDLGR